MVATTAWISAAHGSVWRMRPSQPNPTPTWMPQQHGCHNSMDATTAWISVAHAPQPTKPYPNMDATTV